MPRLRTLSDEIVLQRAMTVFWHRGYAGTSLRDLMQATGLSAAALYNRFADKDGLFVAVLRRYAEEGLVERIARLSAGLSPLAAIRAFFDELIAMSVDDPERRGCLLVNTALDGAAMSQSARDVVRERLGEVETFFAAQIRLAIADGTLAADMDVAASAAALLGTVLGMRVLARLDPDPARLRSFVQHGLTVLRQHEKRKLQ